MKLKHEAQTLLPRRFLDASIATIPIDCKLLGKFFVVSFH